MRNLFFSLLLCQAALAQDDDPERGPSGISEFDFIIPQPDATYELGPDRRFPIVLGVQNATLWNGTRWEWEIKNYTLPNSPDDTIFVGNFDPSKNGSDQSYLYYDTILAPSGTYHFSWTFADAHSSCPYSNFRSYGITFKTAPGGQKANFSTAVTSDCSKRASVMSHISLGPELGCNSVINRELDTDPTPCALSVSSDTASMISKELDDQFTKRCGGKYAESICPNYKSGAAAALAQSMWFLSLPIMALLL